MKNKPLRLLILLIIIFIGGYTRLTNLAWDQNYFLHPDERFLLMYTYDAKLPNNFLEYLNPGTSKLSPYNNNRTFFVYGTLPTTILKIYSSITKADSLEDYAIAGRTLSAYVDLFMLLVLYLIGRKLYDLSLNKYPQFKYLPEFACLIYAISVLPIQLAHFFATDTFANLFTALTFYFLLRLIESSRINQKTRYLIANCVGIGIGFGLALACKISAVLFLPIIGIVFIYGFIQFGLKQKKYLHHIFFGLMFMCSMYVAVRIGDPYMFKSANIFNPLPDQRFIANLKELQSFSNPIGWFPPSVQWMNKTPILFPLTNLAFYGLGLPLFILFIIGLILILIFIKKNRDQLILPFGLILLWIFGLFIYQGSQFVSTMRYFLPIYPFIALISAFGLLQILKVCRTIKLRLIIGGIIILLVSIWPMSFLYIYSQLHTRVNASIWIYENIPTENTLTCDHWDDCLPLNVSAFTNIPYHVYPTETLHLFDPESNDKWSEINRQLEKVEYIVISSNRLYDSMPTVPSRYPQTTDFYDKLFTGELKFEKVAEVSTYPTLKLPCFITNTFQNVSLLNLSFTNTPNICGIQFNDDNSEEAFTVYDHPKVMIFKKKF